MGASAVPADPAQRGARGGRDAGAGSGGDGMTPRAALAALVLAAIGPAALADACPAVITATDWDDGTRITLASRASDMTVLDTGIPLDGGESFPVRFRMQAGLIPLWNSGADGPVSHDWTTPLPGPSDLLPGARFDLTGSL